MSVQSTTRVVRFAPRGDRFGQGVAGSVLLHAAVAGSLIAAAYFIHTGENWGNSVNTAGAIQATMVSSLPLPPKITSDQQNVLTTETPSPAPVTPAPKTVEAPKPDAIPIPTQTPKPPKVAEKTTPAPPLHPQPIQVKPNKVQMGEAPASIPMSSTQTRAGTFSATTSDNAFGTRFAYYVQQITQKVASQWYTSMLDPQAAGHRVYITFQIERDGTPTHIQIAQRSGDNTLDQTALSAVEHIDTFPPLPDAYGGSHINVTYYFDPPPRQ